MVHSEQNTKNRALGRQEKHFIGISQPGTGKTLGALLSILNDFVGMDEESRKSTHYLFVCSTYDMAFATFQYAIKLQETFRYRFKAAIGFLSKEALDVAPAEYNVLICTPAEIIAKLEIDQYTFSKVVLDDADAYGPWQKMINMIGNMPESVYYVLSSHKVTELDHAISSIARGEIERCHFTFNDHRHYVQAPQFAQSLSSMDLKVEMLHTLFEEVSEICPKGQILVFCKVSQCIGYSRSDL